MNPKVSVIMPVLNGERYIDYALRSIVDQTYKNIEAVIVDDGSTDGTVGRIHAFQDKLDIRVISHPSPMGIPRSMNDGVNHATGELITFLDHDDTWLPAFAETQVAYLQSHPDVGMVHSDFQTIDPAGQIIEHSVARCRGRQRPSGQVFPELFMDSFVAGNTVLIRRECFTRLGGFDESLRWGDYHMWLRIARHYKVDYVDTVLTTYRQHPGQSTRNRSADPPDKKPAALIAIEKLVDLYPEIRQELGDRVVRRRMAAFYFDLAYRWYRTGEPANARQCLRSALKLVPTEPRYLLWWAAMFVAPSHGGAAMRLWRRLTGREPETVGKVHGAMN